MSSVSRTLVAVAALISTSLCYDAGFAQTKTIVPKNVGKVISVRGVYSERGKLGPFLTLKERREPVYLLSEKPKTQTKIWFPEGAKVSATGVQLFRGGGKTARPDAANAYDYYYFDIETVKLRQH